jgi:K+ transporter
VHKEDAEVRIFTFIVTSVFFAGASHRLFAGEYLEAVLGFCCVIQMWVIEYLRFILEKERELREACNHLALKTLEDLSEEFKKKHREQLERQKRQ